MVLGGKYELSISRLKSTPPTGAPKATEIPAAAAPERSSRFLTSEDAYFEKYYTIPNLLLTQYLIYY